MNLNDSCILWLDSQNVGYAAIIQGWRENSRMEGDRVVRWVTELGAFCLRRDKRRFCATPGRSVRILGSIAILCLAPDIGVVAGFSESRAESRIDAHRAAVSVIALASRMDGDSLAAAVLGIGPLQLVQPTEASIARRAYRKREYKTAFKIWEKLAIKGDPEAQHMLGVMHENGEGVRLDPVKAAAQRDVDEVVKPSEIRAYLEAAIAMSYQATGHRRIKNPRIWSLHDLSTLTG